MAKNIEIGGRLHSIATNNVVTGANEVLDDTIGKKQSVINNEIYSLVDSINAQLETLSPDQQEALGVAEKANNNEAKLGYYTCGTQGNVAAKAINDATGYILSTGGSIKVKMTNANTADNVTLNINLTGVRALYYDGEPASANNSWKAGEVVEIYYDGTNFYANNVAGVSKFGTGEKVKEVGIDAVPTAGSDNLVKSGGVFDAMVPITGSVLAETVTTISETPTGTVNFYNDSVIPIKAGNKILIGIIDSNNVLKGIGLRYNINNDSTIYNLNFPETIITLEEDLESLKVYCYAGGFNTDVYGDISLNVSVYDKISVLDRKLEQTVAAERSRAQGAEVLLQKNLDNAIGYPVTVEGSVADVSFKNVSDILVGGKKYRIILTNWNASEVESNNLTFAVYNNGHAIARTQKYGGFDFSGYYIDVNVPQDASNITVRYRISSGSFTIYDHSELFKYFDEVREDVHELSDSVQGSLQDVAELKEDVYTRVDAEYKHIFITSQMHIRQDVGDGSYIKPVSEDDVVYLKAKDTTLTYALYTLVKSYSLENNTIELMTGETQRHLYSKNGTIVNIPEDGFIIITNITKNSAGAETLDEFKINDTDVIIKGLKDRVYELENREDSGDTPQVTSAVMFSDNDVFDLESYWKFGKDYLDRLYAENEIDVINAFISKFKARAGEGKYQIAVISDTHGSGAYTYYSNSNLQFITCMRSIAAFNAIVGFCDAGIHGGDISCDYGTSRRRQLGYMRTLIRQFRFDKPFFITKGNHDENNNGYIEADLNKIDWNNNYYVRRYDKFTRVTKETWTGDDLYVAGQELISDKEFSSYVQHWLAPDNAVWGNGAYYYYDVDAVKIRVVVGNSFPINNDYAVSNREEYLWLAQEAFDFSDKGADKGNWKVLMLRHTQGTNLAENVGGQPVQLLGNCINALRNGGTWSYDGYEFDFGEINGGGIDFIAHIHGHEHQYCFSNSAGYFDIGETSACTSRLGEATRYGISVWTIDTVNNKVYEDTISGNSWVYNYDSGRLEVKRGDSFRCAKSGLSGTVVVSCTEPTITIEDNVVTIGNDTPFGNYTVSVSDGTTTFNYLITVVDGQDDEVTVTEWVTPLSSFAMRDVDNLVNYYLKSETYTKAEVAALIGAIQQFHYEIYASTSDVTTPANNVLYLIGPASISGSDKYEEYVYANNTFVKIGDTSIDLSGYVTTTALNTALANYTTTANLTTLLSGKVDKVQGKGLSTEDYTTAEKAKLAGIAEGAEVNVQPDWNQSDSSADDYIKNKPTIPVITDKADKVASATNGNLAGLDSNGNLTDSGIAASGVVVSTSVRTIVTLTQAQYDALTTKDANTEYNIIESV